LSLTKIGADLFVKKPLETLAGNILEGRGFSFDIGSSGLSTTGALGAAAAAGLRRSFGSEGGDSGGSFFSSLFGGSRTALGRLFGSGDSSGGDYGGGSDYGGDGDYGGGGDYGAGDLFGAFGFHTGGIVGYGGTRRLVPAVLFRTAPRFHTGGLLPDEVPIIAQRGERVLNREEARDYASGRSGPIIIAPMHVHAADAESFRRSTDQISAGHQKQLDRAMRSL
jgi:hypothetical protein